MPREVISVNVGGAGVRIGEAVTHQYMVEHGIDLDGTASADAGDSLFFDTSRSGQYTPRSVSVDLDPSGLDVMRSGPLSGVFHPEFLINGTCDGANNFARGHYSAGRAMIDKVNDRLRKLVDNCDNVQGFVVTHSLSGGTGSGLGALILERIAVDYRKKAKFGFEVLAGDLEGRSTPSQTYNQLLGTHWLLDHTAFSVCFDNSKMSKICQQTLGIERPSYSHVNSLIAKVQSGITGSLRFNGEGNTDLNEWETSMVQFPRLHFMTTSFTGLSAKTPENSERDLASLAVDSSRSFVEVPDFDPEEDKYMALSLCYRGGVHSSRELAATAQSLKESNKVSFVEWVSTTSRAHCIEQPMGSVENDCVDIDKETLTMVGNNVAINRRFSATSKKYDSLISKRAYVHHYTNEGMEEGEFAEAREDLGFLEKDYLDVLTEQGADDDDDADDDF